MIRRGYSKHTASYCVRCSRYKYIHIYKRTYTLLCPDSLHLAAVSYVCKISFIVQMIPCFKRILFGLLWKMVVPFSILFVNVIWFFCVFSYYMRMGMYTCAFPFSHPYTLQLWSHVKLVNSHKHKYKHVNFGFNFRTVKTFPSSITR